MRRRFRPAPRPIEPACPAWCTADHAIDLDLEDGIRLHSRPVHRDVEVIATDDLEIGTRAPVEIIVRATSCATPAEARALALAILAGGDYLDGGNR